MLEVLPLTIPNPTPSWNPLEDVESAHKVKRVIANGRIYDLNHLLNGGAAPKSTTER